MAQKVNNLPIFAIGLGFREPSHVDYANVFTPREPEGDDKGNIDKIQDFLRIMQERLEYIGGNAVIDLFEVDLEALHQVFMETEHYTSAAFIEEAMKNRSLEHYDVIICIMTEDLPALNMEEKSLTTRLKVDKKPVMIQAE